MQLRHEPMSPVFDKWHVEGLPIPAVFHRFAAPDLGDPHDHPWSFRSVILTGGYVEEVFDIETGSSRLVSHTVGESFFIEASHIHRIVDLPTGECWTLIMPEGPKLREPGFYQFRQDGAYHRPWHREDFQLFRAA